MSESKPKSEVVTFAESVSESMKEVFILSMSLSKLLSQVLKNLVSESGARVCPLNSVVIHIDLERSRSYFDDRKIWFWKIVIFEKNQRLYFDSLIFDNFWVQNYETFYGF